MSASSRTGRSIVARGSWLALTGCLLTAVGACGEADDPAARVVTPHRSTTAEDGPLGPGRYESQDTVDENGAPVRVTTFQRAAPADGALAAQERACEGGALEACHAAGNLLLGLSRYAEAERVWKDACDAGHGASCADLGYQYNNPFIEMPHPEWALDVLTQGCESDEHPPIACASLAERYADDRYGVAADPARHRELLQRACADRHFSSCRTLGEPPPPE